MGDMADLALEHAELECYPDFPDYWSDVKEYDTGAKKENENNKKKT